MSKRVLSVAALVFSLVSGVAAEQLRPSLFAISDLRHGTSPDCTGPGATAFEADLEAPSLNYLIHDADRKRSLAVSAASDDLRIIPSDQCRQVTRRGSDVQERNIRCDGQNAAHARPGASNCFVMVRRGTERVRVPTACPADTKPQDFPTDVSVAFKGTVAGCLSLEALTISGGAWTIALSDATGMTTYQGAFDPSASSDAESAAYGRIAMRIRGAEQTYFTNWSARDPRPTPTWSAGRIATGLHVKLGCIPLGRTPSPFHLFSELRFFLNPDDIPSPDCDTAECKRANPLATRLVETCQIEAVSQ